jgi:predicted O-methyltransferase YrrM
MKILYLAYTCELYKDRFEVQRECCLKGRTDYAVVSGSSDADIQADARQNELVKKTRKMFAKVSYMYPDYDWYVKIDDDTYVVPERLNKFLETLPDKPLIVGDMRDRNNAGKMVRGGCYAVNRKCLTKIIPYLNNRVSAYDHEDQFISRLADRLGIGFIHTDKIWDWRYWDFGQDIETDYAFHPLKEVWMLETAHRNITNPNRVTRNNLPKKFDALGYKKGVEVGVYRGGYASKILAGFSGHLTLVDPWQNYPVLMDAKDAYDICKKAVEPYKDRVTFMRTTSEEASSHFEDESLDFVYIDGDHTYNAVTLDLEKWYPKVKKGGLFYGHDYYWEKNFILPRMDVKPAVDAFVAKNKLKLEVTQDFPCFNSWMIWK